MKKLTLIPLKVSWAVESGTPNIQAQLDEDGQAVVHFLAFFGPDIHNGKYKRVVLHISQLLAFRMLPGHSEGETLDPTRFSIETEPSADLAHSDPAKWLAEYSAIWRKTGFAPMPGVYTVRGVSSWVEELDAPKNIIHFIVVGEDCYFEFLAGEIKIEILESSEVNG